MQLMKKRKTASRKTLRSWNKQGGTGYGSQVPPLAALRTAEYDLCGLLSFPKSLLIPLLFSIVPEKKNDFCSGNKLLIPL